MLFARLACESDSKDTFLWRNDPITRKSFFNSSKISWKEHCDWFKQKLSSPSSKIIILENDSNKIGVVRYDKKDSFYYVSINTNPDQRGKGYSSKMLLASEKLISSKNNPVNIIADILKENELSVRTFIRAGYKLKTKHQTYDRYVKLIKNSE